MDGMYELDVSGDWPDIASGCYWVKKDEDTGERLWFLYFYLPPGDDSMAERGCW